MLAAGEVVISFFCRWFHREPAAIMIVGDAHCGAYPHPPARLRARKLLILQSQYNSNIKEAMMAGKKPTAKDVEKITLIELIIGFEHQCIAMPAMVEKMLELEGKFTKQDFAEAKEMFRDIMTTKVDGRNLTVCQLASMYLAAELSMQRMNAPTITLPQGQPELHEHTGVPLGYG